jgi:hypothetical protein
MKFGRAPTTLIIRSIALVQKADLKLRQEVYSWGVLEHKRAALTPNTKTPESQSFPGAFVLVNPRLS